MSYPKERQTHPNSKTSPAPKSSGKMNRSGVMGSGSGVKPTKGTMGTGRSGMPMAKGCMGGECG